MFEPVDPEMEHERFRSKQLLKQSIKEILAEGKVNGEFEFEDLNTAALGVVGAMTFVVIEPLNPSRNVMFDQNYKDHFVKQIADFVLTQYIDRRKFSSIDTQNRHIDKVVVVIKQLVKLKIRITKNQGDRFNDTSTVKLCLWNQQPAFIGHDDW